MTRIHRTRLDRCFIVCALIALALGTSPSWAAKICVDAGHGGTDSGATGNGLLEKNCNLSAALKFKAWLDQDTQDAGGGGSWSVVMTRSTDVFISLQGRCDIANNNNADRFMCIHSNAFDGSAHGIETYCSTTGSSTSQDLRNKVYEEAIAMWPLTPRGTKTAAYYVLNHTNMPSELHEMAFIDNAGDAVYLGSDTHLNNHALSELYAIQRHYGITKYRPGSGPTPTPSPTPSPSPTPGNDIIIDNPAAVYTGSWSVGTSSTDKYGADYDYANSGSGATATFNANLPSAGSWQVSVWYPQGSNRANNAPYTVYYDGGSQTFPVNQQAGGGAWNVLGTFTFAGGGGQVVIGTTGANPSVVMADAVRFTLSSATPTPSPTPSPSPSPSPTPSPSPSPSPSPTPTLTPSPSPTPIPADIIIDNPAASFSGTWSTGTSSVDKYGADYRYATAGSGATATYNANVPAAGNYRVSIWYPQGTNRSNNAPYKVNYNGGSQTFNVNQQANGGKWNVLGTFSFAAGGGQVVIMTTGANPTVVMADAVRFTGQ